MLTTYKEKVQAAKLETKRLSEYREELVEEIDHLETGLENYTKAYEISKQAALLTQQHIADYFASLVTQALHVVFDESYQFKVDFVERRGATECDLYVEKDGEVRDIFEDSGGGLADVCGFAMQVGYILLSPVDNVLITDEAMRHLALESHELFLETMNKMCEELQFQIIMVTHSPVFKAKAARVFHVEGDGNDNAWVKRII